MRAVYFRAITPNNAKVAIFLAAELAACVYFLRSYASAAQDRDKMKWPWCALMLIVGNGHEIVCPR